MTRSARIETGERYSMVLAQGNPLADQVNDVITELKRSGFVAELHRSWFGSEPLASSSTVSVVDRPRSTSVGWRDAGFAQTFLNWSVLLNSMPLLLAGLRVTLLLGATSIACGLALGLFLAMVRLYGVRPAGVASKMYTVPHSGSADCGLLRATFCGYPAVGNHDSGFRCLHRRDFSCGY